MVIDIKNIRNAGRQEESFFFLYTPEQSLELLPNVNVKPPVKINGVVTLTDKHSCILSGEVVFTLIGDCTRCLKETQKEYIISFSESCGEDENSYPVVNDKIDLDKIINDIIILNTPVNFLCKEDCKGVCLGCGVNLNDGTCKCEK